MSGEGLLPNRIAPDEGGFIDAMRAFAWEQDARGRERADVLGRLRMKRENCLILAANQPQFADSANAVAEHLKIEIEYLAQGLHVGALRGRGEAGPRSGAESQRGGGEAGPRSGAESQRGG